MPGLRDPETGGGYLRKNEITQGNKTRNCRGAGGWEESSELGVQDATRNGKNYGETECHVEAQRNTESQGSVQT